MSKRIQRKRTKGWRMPPNTMYVGRETEGGNPFKVGIQPPAIYLHSEFDWNDTQKYLGGLPVMSNEEAVRLYRKYAMPSRGYLLKLRGKDLACWCPLDRPCHADVLLELANAPPPAPPQIEDRNLEMGGEEQNVEVKHG
jgi:hypothetical protein